MAERISEIPPELVEYFAEAQRLRLLFEEDQTDFIASQMGLPKLDERDPMFSDRWICKPLHDVHNNQAFRKPLGASGKTKKSKSFALLTRPLRLGQYRSMNFSRGDTWRDFGRGS